MKYPLFFLLAASAAAVQAATPDSSSDAASVHEVVITATRLEVDPFSVPAAISSVSGDQLRNDALGINLSDDLSSVPGLLARNRNNYAQDQQISIRGIGANSAFGIRGVRVYQDGIPATSFAVDDVRTEFERLRGLGVRFVQEPLETGPVTTAVLDDTCGNLIQLVQSR